MLRTDLMLQVIPREELRQVEITESSPPVVKWWLSDGGDPYSMQFFDEEEICAQQFFDDLCDASSHVGKLYVRWERVTAEDADESEIWHRNGEPVTAEAS